MADFFSQFQETTPSKTKKPLRRRTSGGNNEGYAPQAAQAAPPQSGGGTRPLRRVSAAERAQRSRAKKGEERTFKALLVMMDAFVGYDSKKKITNITADSVDGLATAIEQRLLEDYEMDVHAESFSIQYFDTDFDHFVDLDSLESLSAVAKLTLVPRDNGYANSRLLDDASVPNAMPATVANAEIVPGSNGKKYLAAEEDKPLQSMKQRPQRLSSGSFKGDAGGGGRFNYNRFKMDLLVGIPFVKRSAKDAKSASRVLFIDPTFEYLNWRAPSSKSEKDHFDMFRVRPVFSKKKEALHISTLQNVKAARSPKGLYFVRLVFNWRNLDMEAADAFTFEELSRGLTMLMNEAKGQTDGNRQVS
mmetsp:Transcript_110193/g.320905  ORF Transcript_110193/g.320905 Transcript_110193/m.320905 type:complete len:361 (+) Transcript_110193:164-1246(+)